MQYIAWHLREAGEATELRQLLFDVVWIRCKLEVAGIHALLDDYRLLTGDTEASQISAALTFSAHVLAANPDHLEVQLRGRLVDADGPTIARLLAIVRETQPAAFAPIRDGYLTRPGPLLRTIPVAHLVTTVAVLPDGRRALSGSDDNTLRLWDLETGSQLRQFEGHGNGVTTIVVLEHGRRALSSSRDKTLRLWDLETGAELRRFKGGSGAVLAIGALADGRRALSSHDNTLWLWDLATGAELACFLGDSEIVTIAVSPAGDRFIVGDALGRVMLFAVPL